MFYGRRIVFGIACLALSIFGASATIASADYGGEGCEVIALSWADPVMWCGDLAAIDPEAAVKEIAEESRKAERERVVHKIPMTVDRLVRDAEMRVTLDDYRRARGIG